MFNTPTLLCISDLGRGPLYLLITLSCVMWGAWGTRRSALFHRDWSRLGWRLAVFWVVGISINQSLKYGLEMPRPWWIDQRLSSLHPNPARGFGMPSGHTQSAVGLLIAMWGISDLWSIKSRRVMGSRWTLRMLGVLWVALIAYSRVALNEHSAIQVWAGALVGVVWGMSLIYAERSRRGHWALIGLCVSLGLWGFYLSLTPVDLPSAWSVMIEEAGAKQPTSPSPLSVIASLCASLFCVWRSGRHRVR